MTAYIFVSLLFFIFICGVHRCSMVIGLVAKDGTTTVQGTDVDIDEIKKMVETAAAQVQEMPTCLHDVHDPNGVNTMDIPKYFAKNASKWW